MRNNVTRAGGSRRDARPSRAQIDRLLEIDLALLARADLPRIDPATRANAIREDALVARGVPASPGVACGRLETRSRPLASAHQRIPAPMALAGGESSSLLVKDGIRDDDLVSLDAAAGVALVRPETPSTPVAVVARDLGIPCVSSVGARGKLELTKRGLLIRRERTVPRGAWMTIDGTAGELFVGRLEIQRGLDPAFAETLEIADRVRRLEVRANVCSAAEAGRAFELGAEGIGLFRTDPLFLRPEARLAATALFARVLGVSPGRIGSRAAAAYFEEIHESEFRTALVAARGRPVSVRLADRPHEWLLPEASRDEALESLRLELGLRGPRLARVWPEIHDLQLRALSRAAGALSARRLRVRLEVLVPMVSDADDLRWVKRRIQALRAATGTWRLGAMIETPRAALVADQIGRNADFLVLGTNDLTQFVYAIARGSRPIPESGASGGDPFRTIDPEGVGRLVAQAVRLARRANPRVRIRACGEHARDPASIAFFDRLGIDGVSVSSDALAVARVAAARARIGCRKTGVTGFRD